MYKILKIMGILMIVLLCTIGTVSCAAPHDCDINENNVVDIFDVIKTRNAYGVYDYWHPYDFNRDFDVDVNDKNIVLNMITNPIGGCLPDITFTEINIPGSDLNVYKPSHPELNNWIYYWNVVDLHIYDNPEYVCLHFAADTSISFTEDYEVCGNPLVSLHYGHAVSGYYIGDVNSNPLNRNNWNFFEPQTDNIIYPSGGMTMSFYPYYVGAGSVNSEYAIIWWGNNVMGILV